MEDLKAAHIQATIAMGDERFSDILEKAFYYGKGMGAFRRAFKEEGIKFNHYVLNKDTSAMLPWDKIDIGIKKNFLIKEYKKSYMGELTPICNESCRICGVC